MTSRPDNTDTAEVRAAKEEQLAAAFLQYLAGTGTFGDWTGNEATFEKRMVPLFPQRLHIVLTHFRREGIQSPFGTHSALQPSRCLQISQSHC